MKHLRLVIEASVHEGNSRPWVSQRLSHTEHFITPLDKGFPPKLSCIEKQITDQFQSAISQQKLSTEYLPM